MRVEKQKIKKKKKKSQRNRNYYGSQNINLNLKSFYPKVKCKLVAIGDLHGDYNVTVKSLKLAGVIPMNTSLKEDIEDIEWIGGNTIVVQLGDQIDRCRPTEWYKDCCADNDTYQDEGSNLKIINLMDILHIKAEIEGGKVISILGNHEIMNCVGDFRYVSPKEFEEFGKFYNTKKTSHKRSFPYGYKERKKCFLPGGMISKIYAKNRLSMVQVGGWIFVHGGLTGKSAGAFTINEVNQGISNWLMGNRNLLSKDIFSMMYDDDDNGIFWTREFGDLANWDIFKSPKKFKNTLDIFNSKNKRGMDCLAKGIIMGHTPQYMNFKGINSSCDNKCWRVDVGASKAFGPCTNSEDENKYRKCAVLMIDENEKCHILKEK